ncbi:MAG: class II fructose-bisphosphate aldolase [Candidatus Hodarchaeales archaeon]|jgi:fructose-bisphosphate aldolase class II
MSSYQPLAGNKLFDAVRDQDCIIMAANVRIMAGVAKGIMRAAKDLQSPVIFELAKSESDLKGGYTGLTPADFSKRINEVADEVQYDKWVLHADHLTIKKGTDEEITDTKNLIQAQIDNGFTSFAIDPSHLYQVGKGDLREELARNIDVTIELARFIEEGMAGKPYGLEVEVGEIGRTDEHGNVITTPEEATTFIGALYENEIKPDVLAIANGSVHGLSYDEKGNVIEQVSIDIPRTRAIVQALKDQGFHVRIAQHGITGTPRELIAQVFPRGAIIKGNVGTFWMNLAWEVLQLYEPKLYQEIWDWTLETYGPKNPGKSEKEIFGKNSKLAIKEFFDQIYSVSDTTVNALEARGYAEALMFFQAFGSPGKAKLIQ